MLIATWSERQLLFVEPVECWDGCGLYVRIAVAEGWLGEAEALISLSLHSVCTWISCRCL